MIVGLSSHFFNDESVHKGNLWRYFGKWAVYWCYNLMFIYKILELSIAADKYKSIQYNTKFIYVVENTNSLTLAMNSFLPT